MQYIIFITQKLDETATNRFQIRNLHPKQHVIKKHLILDGNKTN